MAVEVEVSRTEAAVANQVSSELQGLSPRPRVEIQDSSQPTECPAPETSSDEPAADQQPSPPRGRCAHIADFVRNPERKWSVGLAALVAALPAFLLGLTLGYPSNAILDLTGEATELPPEFFFSTFTLSLFAALAPLGAIPGSPVGGWIADRWGRKCGMVFSAVPYLVGYLMLSYAHFSATVAGFDCLLLTGRFLTGVGMGWASAVGPVYTGELCSAKLRGIYGNFFPMFLTIGILFNYALGSIDDFRYYHISLVAVGIVAVSEVLMFWLPETPIWLLSREFVVETESTESGDQVEYKEQIDFRIFEFEEAESGKYEDQAESEQTVEQIEKPVEFEKSVESENLEKPVESEEQMKCKEIGKCKGHEESRKCEEHAEAEQRKQIPRTQAEQGNAPEPTEEESRQEGNWQEQRDYEKKAKVETRIYEAEKVLRWLRGEKVGIEEEMEEMKKSLSKRKPNAWKLFLKRRVLQPLVYVLIIFIMQQDGGINVITPFAGTILSDAGVSNPRSTAVFAVGGAGLVGMTTSLILIELIGRKILLIVSGSGQALAVILLGIHAFITRSSLCASSSFTNSSSMATYNLSTMDPTEAANTTCNPQFRYMALCSVTLFVFLFTLGYNSVPYILLSELLPLSVRGVASGIASAVSWGCAALFTGFYFSVTGWLTPWFTLWAIALFDLAVAVFVAVFVPETKGRSLEELEGLFVKKVDAQEPAVYSTNVFCKVRMPSSPHVCAVTL